MSCRDLRQLAQQARAKNLEILSPQQKERLQTLEDAIAINLTVIEGQLSNIVGPLLATPGQFISNSTSGFTSFGAITIYPQAPFCRIPSQTQGQ